MDAFGLVCTFGAIPVVLVVAGVLIYLSARTPPADTQRREAPPEVVALRDRSLVLLDELRAASEEIAGLRAAALSDESREAARGDHRRPENACIACGKVWRPVGEDLAESCQWCESESVIFNGLSPDDLERMIRLYSDVVDILVEQDKIRDRLRALGVPID